MIVTAALGKHWDVVPAMPSSVIRSFAYDEDHRSLAVEFVSGRRYRYDDVPSQLVDRLRRARSKGQFFNKYVRDNFATIEID
jgi:hypothetical protein